MKKKILIPIFILMISLVAVVTASWQILNFKENKVPSEYFPYEVNAVQNVIYNGQEHDVTITLTEGSVVDNNDLIIEYYRYSTSINDDDVIHNITLLQNEKPKHSGIYIAKIYRMVDVTTEDRGVTQEKEEIYNVRLNINKRQVIVSSYADKFIYFGQDTSGVTFGYDIEQALEGSDRGLVAGDELKESSSFVLDAGYKKYQTYGVCTIAISGLYDVNDNYEIIYNPGEFHVKQLPISFSWDTSSLKTIYSGKYQRPSIGTYSTSVEGVDMTELLQNVNFNAIYDTDTTKLINAGLYDVTCTGFDNPNFIFDESGSTDYKDTAFEIEKCKVNYSWYTDTEQKLIFNGESQHQKAYLTSIVDGIDVEMVVDSFKLLENESNNGERDTTYINYKTSGEIEANVNKNGDKLYADLYTIELLSLSNPNYEFAEGSTSTTYKIYPKELTLAWHEDNSFVFSNKPQIVEADEIGLIDNYPSGLYFDGAETNANYVNEETMIPSYTNSDNELITFNKYYSTARVTSTNYYLAEDNIKNEFKITQLEVFITWGSQVEFVYNGQMNSHCPTASIALETGYPDAGLTILGSEVNANSDHLGNKYNGFDDYMAQAKISNTNYKLLENTTCDFKVKASPLVVGINEDLPDGAVSINSTSRSLSRNTSYADITYEYFGKRFIPTAFYEGTLYGDDTCSVDVKYVKDNGTLSAEGALDVGTYLAKTVGLSNTNYSIVEEKTINVVINPRPIYISWGNLEFNYDSESHLPTVSISNLCDIDIPTDPNADPLVYVRVDNSFAQTNANITYTSGNLIAGFNRYPVSLTSNNITNEAGEVVNNYLVYGSRGHNYICSTESLCENTFTIRQAQLTINALKNEITYGDVPSLSKTSHINLVGLQPNDTIDSLTNLTYDINYDQFDDVTNALKNVSYEASWTGVTNTNYEITYNSAEFVVNKKPVTISWDTVTTHVYSSSLWAPTANIIGLVNNDKVSVEIAGKQKDTNVKTGLTYNASVTKLISDDSLDQADNYIISNPDTTQQFTITQKPVTINWTNINLTYTSGLQFAEYEFVGVLNNEDLLETISGKQTDANKNSKGVFGSAYKASITEIGNLNYMFASNADKEEEFYINALGITVNWITPEFSYKGISQLPTISSLSTIYDSDINSVSTNITASSESTVAGFIAGIWAGSHKATAQLTGAKASNYEIINNETFDYNISKAPLEVILNGNTIIYGDAPVDNGYTIKGFENGETVAVLGNSISYTHSYSRYGNIGDYAINASGFTSNNYEITYQPATLTVEARKVEIAFTDLDSYVYKKGEYSPIAIVTNLARSSDVCTVELTKFINAGEHTSTVVSISNSNYTIVGTNYSHKFTITPKPITINWSGTSGLIYDSTVQKISAASSDIIPGDTVNYTITYTAGDGKNAGNHTAKVSIDNDNYSISVNETVSYRIEPKEITIEWTNLEFTYVAGQTYCPTATAKGLLGVDTCELIVEGAASSVGQHTATVTEIRNGNYKLPANPTATFEILPAPTTTKLTVTIYGNVTIQYGDELVLEYVTESPSDTSKVYYTISGFKVDDTINSLYGQLSLTTNYNKGNNVGTYTISGASGFTHDDYEFEYVFVGTTITVQKAQITIEDMESWITINPFIEGSIPKVDTLSGKFTFNGKTLLGTYFIVDTMFNTINYGSTESDSWDGTIKIKFTPNDSTNFAPLEHDTEFTMYAVARVGNNYYGTIAKAIEAANDGSDKNVYVIPGLMSKYQLNIPIKDNLIIPAGVKLYIPYQETNYVSSSFSSLSGSVYSDQNSNSIKENRQTLINLINEADIIIESGASLFLGGETNRIGITGKYCEINLDTGSMIDCYGTFECYGYIKENKDSYKNGNQTDYNKYHNNSFDEGRMIRVNSSGKLETIIAIYSDLSAMGTLNNFNNAKVFPFTKFDFPNLQTYVEVNAKGTFSSKMFIQVTSSQTNIDVNEVVKVVGSSDGLFMLKGEEGNIAFEYCPTNVENTNTEGITRIFINGMVEQGFVNIKVYTETVTTSDKFIPLSYKFNIFINTDGTYSSSYQIKFLPGSKLRINSGGTLNLNSEMIFYEGTQASKIQSYSNITDAELINNGTIKLTSKGKLGAFIQTEATDNSAMLDFSETTSNDAFTVSSTEGENAVGVTTTSKGLFVDESAEGKSKYQFVSKSTVYSDSNGGKCWDGDKNDTVNLKISLSEEEFSKKMFGYQVVMADDSNGNNPVNLTSDVIDSEGEYSLIKGKYVQVNISRHESAVIKYKISGEEKIHDSTQWYLVTEDLEIIITPKEGVSLQVTTDNLSGCGWTTFRVYESIDGNSNWYLVAEFIGNPEVNTTYIVKGWYFKVESEVDPLASLGAKSELNPDKYTITPAYNNSSKFKEKTAYQALTNYVVHMARKETGGTCIAEGTLITLADGTKRAVEDLRKGDLVMAFDHLTGKVTFNKVIIVVKTQSDYYKNTFVFDDGTELVTINEHGIYDLDLNMYVNIDHLNYLDYLGHRFVSIDVNGNIGVKTLVDVESVYESGYKYDIVTNETLNYVAEDTLSVTHVLVDVINTFEFDQNMKYDQEKMMEDINKYGLYEYDEWSEYCDIKVFEEYNIPIMKVGISKGLYTKEYIISLINTYVLDDSVQIVSE